jgi:hypothetical protein
LTSKRRIREAPALRHNPHISSDAGILVVPSNVLAPYLTDRIGNIGELRPYFPLWSSYGGARGALRIVVVEHDAIDRNVPRIPKGTDGRALV